MEEPRERKAEPPSTAPSEGWDENLRPGEVYEIEDDVTGIIIAPAPGAHWAHKKKATDQATSATPQPGCPICARAAVGPADRTCGHLVFTTDPTGYTGASFALQYCDVYIEREMPSGKTFLEIDQEIIGLIRQHMEIANGRGYSTAPKESLDAATAAVRSYLLTLGYALPE